MLRLTQTPSANLALLPDDVRALAVPVLAHRMMLDTKTKYGGISGAQMIEEALEKIPVPR